MEFDCFSALSTLLIKTVSSPVIYLNVDYLFVI